MKNKMYIEVESLNNQKQQQIYNREKVLFHFFIWARNKTKSKVVPDNRT